MEQCPEDRPTARELQENPWVRGEKTAEHSMTDAVQHLREFNARRKFKVFKIVYFQRKQQTFFNSKKEKFLFFNSQAATLAVRATHRAIALSHCHPEVIS